MSKEIVVQGERYSDVANLWIAVEETEETLEGMPDGTPEYAALREHNNALRNAYAEATGWDSPEEEGRAMNALTSARAVHVEEDELEPTHDLRVAADTGAPLLCPTCGNEVDFPEVPPMDKTTERCPICDGWGKVVTGSRVDGHIWKDCPQCRGEGIISMQTTLDIAPPRTSVEFPEAPGALWDADAGHWNPPPNVQPPWAGAVWDPFYGKWN